MFDTVQEEKIERSNLDISENGISKRKSKKYSSKKKTVIEEFLINGYKRVLFSKHTRI